MVVQQLPSQLRWNELGGSHKHYWLSSHYGLYNEIMVERDAPQSGELSRTWYPILPINHDMAATFDKLAADYRNYNRIPASALPALADINDIELLVRTTRYAWMSDIPPAVDLHLLTKRKVRGTVVRFRDLSAYEQQIIRLSFPELERPFVLFENRWPVQWRFGFTLILIGIFLLFGLLFHTLRARNLI